MLFRTEDGQIVDLAKLSRERSCGRCGRRCR